MKSTVPPGKCYPDTLDKLRRSEPDATVIGVYFTSQEARTACGSLSQIESYFRMSKPGQKMTRCEA